MKNRITQGKKIELGPEDLRTFFLACEFKPNSDMFSVIDSFAYDIQPAFIFGSLGILSYDPMSYSIIDTDEETGQPLLGYIVTITHPDTILLLEKIKGYYGMESFNTHIKKIVDAYTDVDNSQPAWCFQLSEYVLERYETLEQVEFGIFDDDEQLIELLEKVSESL